ncbi:MAG TPA: allophanate hydrolase subunit 1 [Gammaproteobacteria bacterium]|jgi:KipI family sensor histidine kinase inhibitor
MKTRFMGEGGLLVETADAAGAHALRRALLQRRIPGLRELIPGYASLLIVADPLSTDMDALAASLSVPVDAGTRVPREHEFKVQYGGEDLAVLAKRLGMDTAELVRRHAAPTYTVAFLGFAPGFPYLTGLDPALKSPRLARPRALVPAGSVAMADEFTGIYPQATPGGWNVLGRCETNLFDVSRAEPALLAPGDLVRFTASP